MNTPTTEKSRLRADAGAALILAKESAMKHPLLHTLALATLFAANWAVAAGDNAVDCVTAGDDALERSHQLQGDHTEIQQTNGHTFRIAARDGWFSWDLKMAADAPQELRVDFGGNGRRGPGNKVRVLLDGSEAATLQLNGTARREYYSLQATNLHGKTAVTARFDIATGSPSSGVSSVCVEKIPPPTIASTSVASSTRTNYPYIVKAINDLHEPESSRDRLKRHFDWWPAKNTNQWAQYDFAKPARVSTVEIYWFDDTGIGECRMPVSWQLFYRKDGEWKPVGLIRAATAASQTATIARHSTPLRPTACASKRKCPSVFPPAFCSGRWSRIAMENEMPRREFLKTAPVAAYAIRAIRRACFRGGHGDRDRAVPCPIRRHPDGCAYDAG